MGSTVIIKNIFSKVESPMPLEQWEQIKDRRDIKQAFVKVDEIIEPPEVAELRERLKNRIS